MPQPFGTAPIARPEGVISAERSGAHARGVAGVQARIALLERELQGASTARAVAVATARLCGWTVLRWPVRSITPITAPVSGSWIGAALHVHRWTGSLKCSGPNTWTAWSTAIAVPIAFVPAPPSLHSVPSAKFMSPAARRRTLADPSIVISMPLASLTTIR